MQFVTRKKIKQSYSQFC